MGQYLQLLDLNVSEAHSLFKLLDTDNSGEVGIQEFIMACMRLKGTAKSIDVATQLHETKRTQMYMSNCFKATGDQLQRIQHMIISLKVLLDRREVTQMGEVAQIDELTI